VTRARELVAACDCRAGCPACVGPVLAAHEAAQAAADDTPRALALKVLAALEAA